MRVGSLIQEDPTCCGATKPMHHYYRACALGSWNRNYWAHVLLLLKPASPRACAMQQEKSPQWEVSPPQLEKSPHSNKDSAQPKINKYNYKKLESSRNTQKACGPVSCFWASLVAQLVKNTPAMQETSFDPWVGKIPWWREWLPTAVGWTGELHGLYRPWGRKESDTTERLSLAFSFNHSSWRGNKFSLLASIFRVCHTQDRLSWTGISRIPAGNLLSMYACMLSCCSHVRLFITLWTIARQASLSMGFIRQEYWSVLPCPPPGDLPDPEINPSSLMSPALAGRFLTTSATWEANLLSVLYKIKIPRAPCLHTLGILFKSRSWVFSLAEMEAITSFSNGMKTVIKWLCHLFLSRLTNSNYFLTFSHGPFSWPSNEFSLLTSGPYLEVPQASQFAKAFP